jgi:ABC-type multidrug transport system ATPase subunit
VFLITHDLDTLYAICDRVAVLADRKVIAVGTIPELLALDHPWIQEYFNGPRGRAAKDAQDREAAGRGHRAPRANRTKRWKRGQTISGSGPSPCCCWWGRPF